jgi:hypothetical protein
MRGDRREDKHTWTVAFPSGRIDPSKSRGLRQDGQNVSVILELQIIDLCKREKIQLGSEEKEITEKETRNNNN